VLSIAAARAAQCFLRKNYTPSKQRYYRSTIKMHESSPIAAALFFLFHLSGMYAQRIQFLCCLS